MARRMMQVGHEKEGDYRKERENEIRNPIQHRPVYLFVRIMALIIDIRVCWHSTNQSVLLL